MSPPKRAAPRRTPAAVAEDLVLARKRGGLWRAVDTDLAATLDLLSLTGATFEEEPLARARDLLASYVRHGCDNHGTRHQQDKTARAAVSSLRTLLLRPADNIRKAALVRSEAARAVQHRISTDAVRHHEDKIIAEIATDAFSDLIKQRADEPQSVEAAIHRLVPMAADIRQQLHDGLCLTYMNIHPADAREQRVIDGYERQVVIKLGDLLRVSVLLARLGLMTLNLTEDEYWFIRQARYVNGFLFDEADDRQFMLEFSSADMTADWAQSVERLLATEQGTEVYGRWIEWSRSCYPTCAFERSTDPAQMCNPHAFVTLLYEIEIKYIQLGFTELAIPGNVPILHHGLR